MLRFWQTDPLSRTWEKENLCASDLKLTTHACMPGFMFILKSLAPRLNTIYVSWCTHGVLITAGPLGQAETVTIAQSTILKVLSDIQYTTCTSHVDFYMVAEQAILVRQSR